jgi:hypothetical protein
MTEDQTTTTLSIVGFAWFIETNPNTATTAFTRQIAHHRYRGQVGLGRVRSGQVGSGWVG